MKLGALLGPIVDAGRSDTLAEQARRFAAEDFSSLWSAQMVGRGFMYVDPFVTLSIAASVTRNPEIGTAAIQIPLFEPAELAHRVFSLQQICGDRLILGVGAGSTRADFDVFNRDYDSRFREFTRKLDLFREFLAHGAVGEIDLTPWPDVLGGPPIYFGTWGKGVERAAREFDGWIASLTYRSAQEVVEALARYKAAGGGRAIASSIQVNAATDLGELRALFDTLAEAGFDDAVVACLPGSPAPDEIRKLVD